jgi:hypothetical protein
VLPINRTKILAYRTLCGSGNSDLPTVDSVTDTRVDRRMDDSSL